MDLFLQFIIVLAVARNEHLKVTRVWDLGFETGCVSSMIKSTR